MGIDLICAPTQRLQMERRMRVQKKGRVIRTTFGLAGLYLHPRSKHVSQEASCCRMRVNKTDDVSSHEHCNGKPYHGSRHDKDFRNVRRLGTGGRKHLVQVDESTDATLVHGWRAVPPCRQRLNTQRSALTATQHGMASAFCSSCRTTSQS